MSFLRDLGKNLLFERPAKKRSLPEQIAELQNDTQRVVQAIRDAEQNERNHQVITHIIGIERWSQRRLRCAEGEEYVKDEYDAYRPAQDTPWQDLPRLFEATRTETIAIAQRLTEGHHTRKIPHNSFGELTVRGWLHYIWSHAKFETRRLK